MPLPERATCANCGAALAGPFCHRCGQEAAERRVPLRTLVRDALGDLMAFDSRILRTLGPLLVRPGFLTREWSEGRRVPYVPPLRLYVFVAALFFLLLAATDVSLVEVSESGGVKRAQVSTDLGHVTLTAEEDTAAAPAAAEAGRPPALLDDFGERLEAAFARDPEGLQDDLLDRLGRVSLLLAPVLGLLLALLYRGRRRYLVEHVVFALHLHAFVFLLVGLELVVLLNATGAAARAVRLLTLAVVVAYLFAALRRVYGGRWWVTGLRTALLLVLYMLVIFLPTLGIALLWTVYAG